MKNRSDEDEAFLDVEAVQVCLWEVASVSCESDFLLASAPVREEGGRSK